jgi:hypothetical protein
MLLKRVMTLSNRRWPLGWSLPSLSSSFFLQNLLFHLGWIAEIDAVSEAHVVGACGQKPLVYPVMAEIALLGNASAHIVVNGFIGACVDALLASHTPVEIHHNDPVGSF